MAGYIEETLAAPKRILITGAYGNLGQACMVEAGKQGWQAVGMSRRTGQDLTNWLATDRFVRNQAGFDLVMLAHGTHRIISSKDTTKSDYDYVVENNLEACVSVTTALLKAYKLNPGGLIVYCSSIQANHTRANRALYAAAKAGIEGYCRGISAELAGYGRAICLRLGQLQNQMSEIKLDQAEISRLQARCYTPWGQTADIARLIFQLYAQSSLTGCVLDIDSGQSNQIWS